MTVKGPVTLAVLMVPLALPVLVTWMIALLVLNGAVVLKVAVGSVIVPLPSPATGVGVVPVPVR